MRIRVRCLLAGGMVVGLAACGASAGKPSTVVTVTTTVTAGATDGASVPTDESAPDTETPSTDASSENAKFGQAYTYTDGLVVIVGAPKTFTLSDVGSSLETKKHTHHLRFTVTITNNSKKNYQPTIFSTSLQSGSDSGEEIFDDTNDLNGSPDTPLLPGRSVKFKIGYGVDDQADLVMNVTPDFDHDAVVFTS